VARDRAARPEAKSLRLFVAIRVSPEADEEVERVVAPLRSTFPRARWVPNQNRHVTAKFLGQTWPRLLTWVEEHVEEAASSCRSFESRLTGLGAFPQRGRARVLWVGLDDRAGRMAEIAHALDAALLKEFKPETRAFAPHLTVARSDPPLPLPEGYARTPIEPVSFRVDRITLFRSHLRRPAPMYEPVGVFPLGKARDDASASSVRRR
jgi:RNA 2',3'-cyclic 3'-phosphodiesterase